MRSRNADVRSLETEACETRLSLRHVERIEAGGSQMRRHRLRDDLVVLDDQHVGHGRIMPGEVPRLGFAVVNVL
jgi:hypothetical protein